jgi:tellurite methyltransferase
VGPSPLAHLKILGYLAQGVRVFEAPITRLRMRNDERGETEPQAGGSPALDLRGLAETRDARILDIRPADAFHAGHIPSAASIPSAEIEDRIYELPPRRHALVVVSDDPSEAEAVAAKLVARGWLRARSLAAPQHEWPGTLATGPSSQALWEPAAMVKRWAAEIPAGVVLDLGCGSGRDAVYLALRGHSVIAIDRLPDALAMAERLASRHAVALQTIQADLRAGEPPRAVGSGLAAILMVRFAAPPLFDWIATHLMPRGFFLLESFTHDQVEEGRMRRAARTLSPEEVLRAFADWDVLEQYDGPDEDGNRIVRFVARKRHRATGGPCRDDGQSEAAKPSRGDQ